ncbi:MAG: putative dehydrogenase [Verrucomicrobiales bacterium]|jgi:predicted dehydrogenase
MHRVLIIGVGSIGERHLRCFQQAGRCDLAFCEPLESRRLEVAERYGIKHAYASLDEALNDRDFDAAVIAAPAPAHISVATRLAKLGQQLLIEKPLSISMEGVDDLARIVREKSLTVAVGYMHRAHPGVMKLNAAIRDGCLGTLRQLRVVTGQPLAVFRPAYREIYFADHAKGGGALQDFLTHHYNVGELIAGPIDRIMTDIAHLGLEGVEVEDTVHSMTRQGNVLGMYSCNCYQHPNEVIYTVVGEAGTARIEYAKKRISWMDELNGEWTHESFEVPDIDTIYIRQNVAFLDAIEGKGEVFCDLDAASQTLRVNLASMQSARAGTWESTSDYSAKAV